MAAKILRITQVCEQTGLPRSSVYALIKTGRFPPPVILAGRRSGWNGAAVDRWVRQRLDGVAA